MNLASYINHTLLEPDCRLEDVERLCKDAVLHELAAVAVPPFYVKQAANLLEDKKVKVATVIGFPLGYSPTPAKVEEIKKAIDDGADELEAVVNLCAVKNKNWNFVANDVDSMTTAAHLKGKAIKIILETGLLTEEEIRRLCKMAIKSQVNFIKACTGHNGQWATIETLALLKSIVGDKVKIEISTDAQSKQETERFIEAGAKRISTSAGLVFLN